MELSGNALGSSFRLHDKELEEQFLRLGFTDYSDLVKKAVPYGNYTYFTAVTPIQSPIGRGNDNIEFIIVVRNPLDGSPPHITQIKASLLTDRPDSNEIKAATERVYWTSDGPIPTKYLISKQIAHQANGDVLRMERAKMLTGIGYGRKEQNTLVKSWTH